MTTDRILRWLPLRLLHLPLCAIGIIGLGLMKLARPTTPSKLNACSHLEGLVKEVSRNGHFINNTFWNWPLYNLYSWRGANCYKTKLTLLAEICGQPSMETLPSWWLERRIFEFIEKNRLGDADANQLMNLFREKEPASSNNAMTEVAKRFCTFTEPSQKALAQLLRAVYLLHRTRSMLSKTTPIGVVGFRCAGKSTFISTAYNLDTNAGSLAKNRTDSIQVYKIPKSDGYIYDFPASDEYIELIARSFEEGSGLLGAMVVVLSIEAVRSIEVRKLLKIVVESGRPCLICLNKADARYRCILEESSLTSVKLHHYALQLLEEEFEERKRCILAQMAELELERLQRLYSKEENTEQRNKISKLMISQEKVTAILQAQELKESGYAEDRDKMAKLLKTVEDLKAVETTEAVVGFPMDVIATSFVYDFDGKTTSGFRIHDAKHVVAWINKHLQQ